MTYLFRREDNGEIIEVDWETMMTQDSLGCIEVDGAKARRCVHLELEREQQRQPKKGKASTVSRPILSDNLGFIDKQLDHFEADRQRHGFRNIEFVRDKDVPGFIQVKCSSQSEWQRYIKHRSKGALIDKTGQFGLGAGNILSPEMLERAKSIVLRNAGE